MDIVITKIAKSTPDKVLAGIVFLLAVIASILISNAM